MNKFFLPTIALLILSNNTFACEWSVSVNQQDNELLNINLGKTVPKVTNFEIKNVADCQVRNDGVIATVCTFKNTNHSVVVSPLEDKMVGQVSMLGIYNGKPEDDSKKYIVLTMCPNLK